jgi:putative phosphoribosyl transferase
VILAVPVAPVDWTVRLAGAADEFVAVETPVSFHAVGQFYRDFAQTSDDQVVDLLDDAAQRLAIAGRSVVGAGDERRTRPAT